MNEIWSVKHSSFNCALLIKTKGLALELQWQNDMKKKIPKILYKRLFRNS